MSRTSPPSLPLRPPSPSTRDRLKHLVARAAVASSALAVGLIIPIKWPDSAGE